MKSITSMTIDTELLTKARTDIPNLSDWVNNKLKEFYANKGDLAMVPMALLPQEVDAIMKQRHEKEQALKANNAEKAAQAEAKLQRITWIHERLIELTKEKHELKPAVQGEFDELFTANWDRIRKEQVELHAELESLTNG